MIRHSLCLLFLFLVGCSSGRNYLHIKVRPIILDNIDWTDERCRPTFKYAQKVYERVYVKLEFLQPIRKYGEQVSILTPDEWAILVEESEQHVFKTDELPIWLVKRIIQPGALYLGLATMATYGYGIAVSENAPIDTVAHEIGHQLGLPHNFELTEEDPDYCGRRECDTLFCKFNIMGYCHFEAKSTQEFELTLSPHQRGKIHDTINSYLPHLLVNSP